LVGMERCPALTNVRREPRKRPDRESGKRGPEIRKDCPPGPNEPSDRGYGQDRNLGSSPPAKSHGDPEGEGVQLRRPFPQTKGKQDDEQPEDQRRAVVAVCLGRSPDE